MLLSFLLIIGTSTIPGCVEPVEKTTTSSQLHDLNNADIYKLTINESNLVLYYSVKSEQNTFYIKYVIEGNVSNVGGQDSAYCEINTTFHTQSGQAPFGINNTVTPWINDKLKPGKTSNFKFEKSFLLTSEAVVQKYRINVIHG